MKFSSRNLVILTCMVLVFTFFTPINVQATTQSAPTNLTANGKYVPSWSSGTGVTLPAKKGIELRWTAASLAQKYEIYRSTSTSGPYNLIATVAATQTSFFDTNVVSGTVYFYRVRAYHAHTILGVKTSEDRSINSNTTSARYLAVWKIATDKSTFRPVLEGPMPKIAVQTLSAYAPLLSTYSGVKYSSSNSSVCSVSSDGILTGKSLGTATITITSIESPTIKTTVVCNPKIGHETSTYFMQKELLRTWGSPYKYLADGKTPATILPVAGTKRAFGVLRNDGRYHAGVDLAIPESIGSDTPVYAMTSGVSQGCINFWGNTKALNVKNDDGTWVQYAEIMPLSSVCVVGTKITKGMHIGRLIPNSVNKSTLIHLVLYKGFVDDKIVRYPNERYRYVPNKVYKDSRVDLLNPDFLSAKCTIE